jgi:uncharacterized membrane protein
MALVQKPNVSTKAVVDSRIMKVGTRLSQEYITSVRAKNDSVWHDRKSWFLGFYFGTGDDRLWVPKRTREGQHPDKRIINFAHPEGKQASQILMLSYLIAAIGLVVVGAVVFGYRW